METVVAPGVWSYTTQFTAGGVPVLLRVRNTFPNPNHYDVRIDASPTGGIVDYARQRRQRPRPQSVDTRASEPSRASVFALSVRPAT